MVATGDAAGDGVGDEGERFGSSAIEQKLTKEKPRITYQSRTAVISHHRIDRLARNAASVNRDIVTTCFGEILLPDFIFRDLDPCYSLVLIQE